VWWATPVECESALARSERLRTVSVRAIENARRRLRALQEGWDEIHPSDSIRDLARTLLRRYPLRAADALQLSAAIAWAEGRPHANAVVTLDKRLARAARTEGFELELSLDGDV
jgi:predicted nucleic acid-binding protein